MSKNNKNILNFLKPTVRKLLLSTLAFIFIFSNFILFKKFFQNENLIQVIPNKKTEISKIKLFLPSSDMKQLEPLETDIQGGDNREIVDSIIKKLKNYYKNSRNINFDITNIYLEGEYCYLAFEWQGLEPFKSELEEMTFVYSIVNSLTEVSSIKSVKFINGDSSKQLFTYLNSNQFFERDPLV